VIMDMNLPDENNTQAFRACQYRQRQRKKGVYIQDTHIKCMYDVCIYPYTYLLIYIYICIISMSGCRDEKCSES